MNDNQSDLEKLIKEAEETNEDMYIYLIHKIYGIPKEKLTHYIAKNLAFPLLYGYKKD